MSSSVCLGGLFCSWAGCSLGWSLSVCTCAVQKAPRVCMGEPFTVHFLQMACPPGILTSTVVHFDKGEAP